MKMLRKSLLTGIIACACIWLAHPVWVKADPVEVNVSSWGDNSDQTITTDTILNLDTDKTIKSLSFNSWDNPSLTIQGDGILTVTGPGTGLNAPLKISWAKLTLESGSLVVGPTTGYGVEISGSDSSLIVNGGSLKIESTNSTAVFSSSSSFKVNGGQADIKGNIGLGLGINGKVAVEGDDSVLNVTASSGSAIVAKDIDFKGGTITAKSTNSGAECISGRDSISISNAVVTATNNGTGDKALYSENGRITISGDGAATKVTATGRICAKNMDSTDISPGFFNGSIVEVGGYKYLADSNGVILTNATLQKAKYNLEYAPNGGSGDMDPTEVYNGDKYIFPQCSFTSPSKKRFDHWEIVGVDIWGYPNDEVTIEPGFVTDGKITVTANWKDMAVVEVKPKGKTLKYNGSEQELVSAGTAENGTMNYAIGDDDTTAPTTGWSEAVPKRKDKGTYYVWYKAKGNDGYADSDPGCTTATISDKDPVKVEKVELSDDKLTLSPGESGQLTATIVPEDATDKEVSWAVDDESVAKISSDDKECTVTAVAAGETTVTVTTKDGGKEAVCTVIVEDKPGPKPEKCTITFDANGGEGEMKPQSGNKGNTVKLKANDFKRSGYEFKNWNTKADGSGDKYDNKQSIELKEDMTLYAQWEKGKPEKDDDDDDDEEESTEPSKPAVVNPDTVEGFFAAGGQPVPGVAMGKTKQGVAAQTLLDSARPAGYLQAFTFNMAVNGKIDHTLKNGVLTIIIPKEYLKAGRTFAIMALDKNGKAWVYPDIDTNPATVTANINFEGYAFALIYKD